MPPLIGITTNYFDQSHYVAGSQITPLPDQAIYSVAEDYVTSIQQAGGIPILLPVVDDLSLVKDYVDLCDGILMTGAVYDIDPSLFGEEPLEKINKPVKRGDDFEIALVRYVTQEGNKPVLGICRGNQIINVALGGSLIQDLVHDGYPEHCFLDQGKEKPQHEVTVVCKDSFVYRALGQERISVNSLHHQAIRKLAPALQVTCVSDEGVIEGFQRKGEQFVVGFQWHPEMMLHNPIQQNIFKFFVQECVKKKQYQSQRKT